MALFNMAEQSLWTAPLRSHRSWVDQSPDPACRLTGLSSWEFQRANQSQPGFGCIHLEPLSRSKQNRQGQPILLWQREAIRQGCDHDDKIKSPSTPRSKADIGIA
jgi:hypothetical protein